MQSDDLRLPPAVPAVLTPERANGRPHLPRDGHGRIEEELVPRLAHPVVELEVLVDRDRLVPAADLVDDGPRIRAEGDVVDGLHLGAVVVRRVADTEPRPEDD